MPKFQEFHNLKLDHLKSFQRLEILVAFGFRTAVLLDKDLSILCRYLDSNKLEKFFCAEFFEFENKNFSEEKNFLFRNSFYLLLAGELGIIKIIDLKEAKLISILKGHTGAIYSMKVVGNYLISGGEDSSIRLWNLNSLSCVGVFGGLEGHKDSVLSLDAFPDLSLILSSGTDCEIKQWETNRNFNLKSNENCSDTFNSITFKRNFKSPIDVNKNSNNLFSSPITFNNIHKCPITKVIYCGKLILSLSNNIVSMVCCRLDEDLENNFYLKKNDPVFIGSVDFFGNCKSFEIHKHILVGVSSNADIYIFDLKNIMKENTPYLVSTQIDVAEDIALLDDTLFITSGNVIHRIEIDFDNYGNDL